ncbi:MAG: ribosome biogenesis factor YjgA [Pseudomonadales bacterium]
MTDDLEDAEEFTGPSKTQLKREAQAFVTMGEKLMAIPEPQLQQIGLPEVVDAVLAAKKITKGNARKRQLQFIGKLLRKSDTTALNLLLNRYDASSAEHANQFHQLESWRERLIDEDQTVMAEIIEAHPDLDRQHLRGLTRNAIREQAQQQASDKELPRVQFRKLFQYLKSLADS